MTGRSESIAGALTARERRLLDQLVEGRTTTEIAHTLGVSFPEAKREVQDTIHRLGFETRDDAAGWWSRHRTAARGSSSARRFPLPVVAGALVALLAAFGGAVALVAMNGDDDPTPAVPDATETPTASATPSPTTPLPTFTPTSIPATRAPSVGVSWPPEVDVTGLLEGEPLPVPEGQLYIERGCWQCDGPTSHILRVSRNADGDLAYETIISGLENIQHITGYAMDPAAGRIVAGVCQSGYCGGLTYPDADASTAIMLSEDNGVTWREIFSSEGGWFVAGFESDGTVLVAHFGEASDDAEANSVSPTEWHRLELDGTLSLPGARNPWEETGEYPADDGRTFRLVSATDTLVADDGSLAVPLPFANNSISGPLVSPSGMRVAIQATDGAGAATLVVMAGRSVYRAYTIPPGTWLTPGRWLDENTLSANVASEQPNGVFPAVIDVESGTWQRIEIPAEDGSGPVEGRWRLIEMLPGPFARVATGDAECLNVRARASLDAPDLACYADDVLLRVHSSSGVEVESLEGREPVRPSRVVAVGPEGRTWDGVTTLDGREGWAAAEFLDY